MISKQQLKKQNDFGDWNAHLFIDSDMVFNAKDALKLIDHDKDIISGAYRRSDRTEYFNAGYFDKTLPGNIEKELTTDTKGLHKVDYVGAGFLLVKTSVFSKMEYPWFRHYIISKGDFQSEVSPDYGFCINAKKAGLDIWVDCDTVITHNSDKRKQQNKFLPSSISNEALNAIESIKEIAKRYNILFRQITR